MPKSYRFGPVEVRTVERQVLIEGRPAPLGARAFDVLLALIERRDRLVTKGELLDIAWAGLVVEENNLQVQISTLRKLLGPGAFATIPGRGYRFAMALEGEEPVAVAADTPEPGRRSSNLPAPVDELIGRDADVLDLAQLVASHRLVTVLGAGGIGKTRLALEVARGTVDEHEDGVWWADLAMVTSPERVVPSIANAVRAQLGDGDASSGLARALAQRRMLLVLDSCEHLAGTVAQVARVVLDAAPGLRILTTSQEALKLPGECLYRLETLAVPPAGTLLNRARTYSAIQLLEQRARAIDRRFVLDSTTIADAIELCRHVDGIALAIEMAAARLPTLGFGVLNARLGEGLRLLRAASRDTAPRYRTMQATVDWSHSLLGKTEQALLRRLSVFVGSFQLASAQRVACSAGIDEWDALDALGNLADKSLVQVSGNDPPRYRLLEPTRLYALERLAEHGELLPTLQLHGEAMAELSNSAEVAFGQLSERAWRGRYTDDFDDCEAAFDRACKRGDAEIAAATSQILTRLDLARSAYATVRRRKEAALALIPHADPLGRARLWSCVSSARLMAFNGVPRLVAAQEEVAAWKGIGDRHRHYDSLCRLAVVTATAGAFDAAEKVFEEALALEDPHWPARMRLSLLQGRSVASAYRGDAVSLLEECQALSALALLGGSERLAALGRLQLAEVAVIEGDMDRAIALGRRAVDEMRSLDLPLGLANSLATLCGSHLASGDLDSARSTARDALPIAHQNGVSAWLFDAIALLAARTARHASAARMLGFADARYAGIQEIRRPWDQLAAGKAAAAVAEVIGAPELARLRIAGSGLSFAEADALAWQTIDDLTEATP